MEMIKSNILTPQRTPIKSVDEIRAEKCSAEVNEILKKHNCRAIPEIIINGEGAVAGMVKIVANKPLPNT